MIVSFKYLGLPKKELNNEERNIEIREDADLEELLNEISKKYSVSREIFEGCSYMINNKRSDLSNKLKDNDRIMIMKSLGGG